MSETTIPTETKTTEPAKQELPDWAQEKISEANAEAAKYRHEKKDAVEAAKAEVTASFQSKVEELENKLAETNEGATAARHEVDRIKAALGADIEADKVLDFAALLKGETGDELASHAEQLKGLFTSGETTPSKRPATDPSQGNAGKPTPLNGDPLLKAVTSIINR